MARAKQTVKNLYAGQLLSPKAVRQAIARIDERLAGEFKERARRRAQILEQMKKYQAQPRDLLTRHKQAAKVIDAMRHLQMGAFEHAVGRPQGIARREERTAAPASRRMAGPISRPAWPNWLNTGGTVVPPYDQASTGWSVGPFGNPGGGTLQKNSETVDPSSGAMSIDIESGFKYGWEGVSGSGNATLGITIYPQSIRPVLLQAWCCPALNYNWGYWLDDPTPPGSTVFEGGVLASGRIRLLILETTQGQFGDFVADQEATLWNSAYFGGYPGSAQWQAGSIPSFEVCTPQVPVNPGKFYIIFVVGEVDIDALADNTEYSQAVAWGILNVSVPSITWELVPKISVIASNRRR